MRLNPKFQAIMLMFVLMITHIPISTAQAQSTPPVPLPLKELAVRGAIIHYLGSEHNMQGWAAVLNGQAQYYYFTPNGEAYVTGLMFDNNGTSITLSQAQNILEKQGGQSLNRADIRERAQSSSLTQNPLPPSRAASRAERFFNALENANWAVLGQLDAPVLYSFVDPNCPFCKQMLLDMQTAIEAGQIQIRLIPVGFDERSIRQAAVLMETDKPYATLMAYINGDNGALPAGSAAPISPVRDNIRLMSEWDIDVTPFSMYRNAQGTLKVLQGRAVDIETIIQDLP